MGHYDDFYEAEEKAARVREQEWWNLHGRKNAVKQLIKYFELIETLECDPCAPERTAGPRIVLSNQKFKDLFRILTDLNEQNDSI
jgi:hypothetical protein